MGALSVLTATAFITVGANGPEDPSLAGVPGFSEVGFSVATAASPSPAGRFCALLADTDARRAQGLMGRRDLGGFDAMVFTFPDDTTGAFYMRNVPVPLSIAWFDANGRFVSSSDMAPCPDRDGCPTYAPPGPYRTAVEVLQGDLARLGLGPETTLAVGGSCTG
ncbi:MAG TPA: DUF192 domain-containing protein [Acidimicrobiales bacterium]|nr:DUF192 domain-containing protein [Acidimicrobiales bacterium]